MRTIWKFPLKIAGSQQIKMPQGPRLLTVQVQDGVPMLWAMVDPLTSPSWDIEIRIHGTGDEQASEQEYYLATFQLEGLVWHVFTTFKPRF